MAETKLIEKLIINNPYEEPKAYWKYDREIKEHIMTDGRRPAGYYKATRKNSGFDDPGEFISLEFVDEIREKVNMWRGDNYPGVTSISYELLCHWNEPDVRKDRFFFCQLEAIETLIWLAESEDARHILERIEGDGGSFKRFCSKMATGTGKTVVMAMLIAWQVLNHSVNPDDPRFTGNILIMAPGIIVRNRLAVLVPGHERNYYDEYGIIPDGHFDRLNSSNVMIKTWQEMMPKRKEKYKVVKIGPQSSRAFAVNTIGKLDGTIVVINDEAHHAWRLSDIGNKKTESKAREMATKWIESLDLINNYNGKNSTILNCYDFSATPFKSIGKVIPEDMMFNWIVSDFGLNDSIESGLTKTPRISVRDDSGERDKEMRSKLYHIYSDPEVAANLKTNEKTKTLPDLVKNAYLILNGNWQNKKDQWSKAAKKRGGANIPPVMITVCNKSVTAHRIETYLKEEFDILTKEGHFIRIDTKTLKEAETESKKHRSVDSDDGTSEPDHDEMREMVNSVGKVGMAGEQLWGIVAVQMLSEGWDAHNVTHIMGLRAFSSQLLCEQLVGRGLRRMSYETNPDTGLLKPEYVDIFGIPFTFLPHEADKDDVPDVGRNPALIFPDSTKSQYEMSWPNIVGIRRDITGIIKIDISKLKPLKICSTEVITSVGMAAVIQDKPVSEMTNMELTKVLGNSSNRLQRIIFTAAKGVFDNLGQKWNTGNMQLLAHLVKTVELFIESGKIEFEDLDKDDTDRKKVTLLFNLGNVVEHVSNAIKSENVEYTRAILDDSKETVFTSSLRARYTTRTTERGKKTHMNLTPYQRGLEKFTIAELDRSSNVHAWIKNERIGFKVRYYYDGVYHMYEPDFIIKMANEVNLILETKGLKRDKDEAKWTQMKEWVRAVNSEVRFGKWEFQIAYSEGEVRSLLKKYSHKMEINTTTCPICGKIATGKKDIKAEFGYRRYRGGTYPQSWCNKCRSSSTPISTFKPDLDN